MRSSSRPHPWIALAVVGLFLVVPGAVLGSPLARSGPSIAGLQLRPMLHPHAFGTSNSTNWGGYTVTGSTHTVTAARASWIEPKIQGTCPSGSQLAAFWVGIDGYQSTTVEQIGTDSDCQGGSPTYYAWYEFFPAGPVGIRMKISPGDVISAQVTFAGGKFTVSLTDHTTSTTFTHRHSMSAARTSAEWIAEAPSGGSGLFPLADFGTVRFGQGATNVTSTCTATIGGVTGNIGSFSGAIAITMVSPSGFTKAAPGPLTASGSSFNMTWKAAGP